MVMKVRAMKGGVLRDMTQIKAMKGGVLRTITRIMAMKGGTMRQVWPTAGPPPPPSISVSVSQSYVFGKRTASTGRATISTTSTTATASSGTGPYTYTWIKASDDGVASSWVAYTPNAASTIFRASVPLSGDAIALFYCVATDSLGASATSPTVTAELSNEGFA